MKNKKLIFAVVAVIVTLACVVGVVAAFLTAKTEKLTNVFTFGAVKIQLDETDALDFKMMPGRVIEKDPSITVLTGSEDAWIFVQVDKSANLDDFIAYSFASGWELVTGTTNVYAYNTKVSAGAQVYILAGDANNENGCVSVKGNVTSDMIAELESDYVDENDNNNPTLSFTGYAVQAEGFADAEAAWNATFGAPIETESESEQA